MIISLFFFRKEFQVELMNRDLEVLSFSQQDSICSCLTSFVYENIADKILMNHFKVVKFQCFHDQIDRHQDLVHLLKVF